MRYEVADRVATITLDRPDRLNAWTGRMHHEYRWAMAEADADPDVRAVVVTGAGRGFCAGADSRALDGHAAKGAYDSGVVEDELPKPGYGVRPEYDHAFAFHFGLTVPVIAAVNGPAAGVGLVLACFADVRFAAAGAKLTTSAPRLGPAGRVRPVLGAPPPGRHRPRRRPAPVQPRRPGRGGGDDGPGQPGPARPTSSFPPPTSTPGSSPRRSPPPRSGRPSASSTPTSTVTSAPPSPSPSGCSRRWSRAPTSPKASPPSPRSAHPASDRPAVSRPASTRSGYTAVLPRDTGGVPRTG